MRNQPFVVRSMTSPSNLIHKSYNNNNDNNNNNNNNNDNDNNNNYYYYIDNNFFIYSLSLYIKIHTSLYLLYMNREVKNGFTPGPIESYRNARKISSYLLRVEL